MIFFHQNYIQLGRGAWCILDLICNEKLCPKIETFLVTDHSIFTHFAEFLGQNFSIHIKSKIHQGIAQLNVVLVEKYQIDQLFILIVSPKCYFPIHKCLAPLTCVHEFYKLVLLITHHICIFLLFILTHMYLITGTMCQLSCMCCTISIIYFWCSIHQPTLSFIAL